MNFGVQRSRGNRIRGNLFAGGEDFDRNTDCREEDLVNRIGRNRHIDDPASVRPGSEALRGTGIPGRKSGCGSAFLPYGHAADIYRLYLTDGLDGIGRAEKLLRGIVADGIPLSEVTEQGGSITRWLNSRLSIGGIPEATVEVMKVSGAGKAICTDRTDANGQILSPFPDTGVTVELRLRYRFAENSWTNAWIRGVPVSASGK